MSESIALLTGATELMPGNASRVARGLRTITLGLQGLDDEGEESFELVSKLQDQFGKLGISLVDSNGQLRSSYDILYDLNGQWSSLDKNTRLYIAEVIAGKNQVDVFNALMSNFNSVISANETAINSAGSAAKENAAHMESLEAKVSALKQAFQELSTSMIDDDVAGLALDIAKSFLELANTDAGRILMIGTAVTALTIASKGLFDAIKVGLLGSLGALSPALIGVLATVTALVAFAPQIMDFFDGLIDPVGNATKKIEENNTQLETNKARLEEINNIPWYDRTSEINAEEVALKALNEQLKEANKGLSEKSAKSLYEGLTKNKFHTTEKVIGYSSLSNSGTYAEILSAEEALNQINQKRAQSYQSQYKSLEEAKEAGEQVQAIYENITETADEYYAGILKKQEAFNDEIEKEGKLSAENKNQWTENTEILSKYVTNIDAIDKLGFGEMITKDMREFYAQAQMVLGGTNDIISALKEQDRVARITSNGFKITEDAAKDFISDNAELAKSIALVNGEFFIEQQSLYDLAAAGNTVAQQMIKDQIALTEVSIEETKKRIQNLIDEKRAYMQDAMVDVSSGNFFYLGVNEELKAELDILANQIAELEKLKSSIESWPTNNPPSTGSKEKDILEDLKKQLSEMAHQAFLLDKQDAEANAEAIVQIYKQMQEAVKTKADELRAKRYSNTSDEIMKLQKLWWGYSDEIKKVYDQIAATQKKFLDESEKALKAHLEAESARYKKLADQQQEIRDGYQDQADAYKIYANFVKESIDEQIKVYQKEIDALEDANEERRNEIALQEKLNNLSKAKDTQVMVYKDGKFQYANDIDAVSSAQNDLNEYQRERQLEKEKQGWQDKIDELEDYKKEWQNFTKDYEDSANLQILIKSELFNKEDLIFSNRIKSAQNFADKYTEAMNRAMAAAKQMEEYQKLAAKYAESASNIGGSGTDWSQAWRDVDAAQKAGAISNAEAEALKQYYHSEKTKETAGTGATFNPGTGTWTNPSGGSGSGSSSSGKGVVGKNPAIYGRANGTLSDDGGIKLVGEEGPEIRVLNKGDGVIPADVTKNLWALGSNPYAFMSNVYKSLAGTGSGNSTMYSFAIDKLELPNATDGASVFEGLRNYAHQRASQRV